MTHKHMERCPALKIGTCLGGGWGGASRMDGTGTGGRLLSEYLFTFRFLYHINILATKFYHKN